MSRVLYFELGDRDTVSLNALIAAFKNILGVLEDLDASLSKDPRGTVRWEVAVLQKSSPPLIGLIGHPRRRQPPSEVPLDNSVRVENLFLDSVAGLSQARHRAPLLSDSAIERVRRLASQSRRLGPIQVFTDERKVPINEDTLDTIKELTGKKHQSLGSILGRLETIAVHRDTEIRIWDENTNRAVRCRYPMVLEDTIKALLRSRVLVSGLVSYNQFGQPIFVELTTVEPYPEAKDLPTIEEMSGLLDDATDGQSLGKFLEQIRDE